MIGDVGVTSFKIGMIFNGRKSGLAEIVVAIVLSLVLWLASFLLSTH